MSRYRPFDPLAPLWQPVTFMLLCAVLVVVIDLIVTS